MTTQYPWNFEPCSPEDECDPTGKPWAHAVRGRKPARPVVMGYGPTPTAADADARTKATQQDAREVLGQRGEVVVTLNAPTALTDADLAEMRREIWEWFSQPHEWKVA